MRVGRMCMPQQSSQLERELVAYVDGCLQFRFFPELLNEQLPFPREAVHMAQHDTQHTHTHLLLPGARQA